MEVGCGTRNSGGREHPTLLLRPDTEGGSHPIGGAEDKAPKTRKRHLNGRFVCSTGMEKNVEKWPPHITKGGGCKGKVRTRGDNFVFLPKNQRNIVIANSYASEPIPAGGVFRSVRWTVAWGRAATQLSAFRPRNREFPTVPFRIFASNRG
jgi:hypothetical protein